MTDQSVVAFHTGQEPRFITGSDRQFAPGESHVDRVCDYWVLILMLGGTLHFAEDGMPVDLAAGEWYFQRPGRRQTGDGPSGAPHYYYLHFLAEETEPGPPGFAELAPGSYHRPPEALLTLPEHGTFDPAALAPLLRRLEEARALRPADPFARQAVFLEVLSQLSQCCAERLTGSAQLARQAMDHLTRHALEREGLAALSARFHFSGDYLSKLIKRHYGLSPQQAVAQIRLGRAMELLVTTTLTVAQVAEAAGFGEVSVFHRAFRRATGLAPGAWRAARTR